MRRSQFKTFHSIITPAKIILFVAWASLCLATLLTNAVKFDMPFGYAGMYVSMATELAGENFILPQTASFYGPGGIPFAYPPLGFYLMAFFIKLGISAIFYARFAPPILSALALLAFFGLSRKLLSSTPAAMLATLLTASSSYLFESHVWSAGIVRGLAFGLFLLAFWAFLSIRPGPNAYKQAILVGVLSGLAALTHLAYIFFLVLWVGLWILLHLKEKIWRDVPAMLAGGLIIILPWLLILANRYGLDVFLHALNAHSTLSIVDTFGNPLQIIQLVQIGISKLFQTPLLAILAIAGLGYQLYQKRYELPILFGVTTFFNIESRRFIIILGILLAAQLLVSIAQSARQKKWRIGLWIIILSLTGLIYNDGLGQIQKSTPSITPFLIEVSEYLSSETPEKSTYLFIADYNEAEWFPYLAQRTPIIAPWGGEWLGNLEEQSILFYKTFECAYAADLPCLNDVILRSGNTPTYFIIMKKKYRPLLNLLEHTDGWKRIYNNREYQVWQGTITSKTTTDSP